MDTKWQFLLALLADDADQVAYRPKIVQIAGSINSAIMLSKIVQLSAKNNYKPFVMYCSPQKWQSQKSREELLWMTAREQKTALDKIWYKIEKWRPLDYTKYVRYYKDWQNQTRYKLNITKLSEDIAMLYKNEAIMLINSSTKTGPTVFGDSSNTNTTKFTEFQSQVLELYKEIVPSCRLTSRTQKAINWLQKDWYTIDDVKRWVELLQKMLYEKNPDWTKKYFWTHVRDFYSFVNDSRALRKILEVNLDAYLLKDGQNQWTKNSARPVAVTADKEHYSWTETTL